MSISLLKDVEGFFDKVFKSTTTAQKILAATGAVAPLVEAGLEFDGDPQAAQVVSEAFTNAQTDLGTFVAIVQKSGTPGLFILPAPKDLARGREKDATNWDRCLSPGLEAAFSKTRLPKQNGPNEMPRNTPRVLLRLRDMERWGNAFSLPSLVT